MVEFLISYRFFVFKNKTGISRTAVHVDVRSCFWHLLLFALIRITYLAVRGIHIISSSIIKPEHGVLLYTWMFARAFGIFCCFCLIWYHIPRSSLYTYIILSCEIDHFMWLVSYHIPRISFILRRRASILAIAPRT